MERNVFRQCSDSGPRDLRSDRSKAAVGNQRSNRRFAADILSKWALGFGHERALLANCLLDGWIERTKLGTPTLTRRCNCEYLA